MDDKKAQKLKILVLVVLGALCLGLALPRFLMKRGASQGGAQGPSAKGANMAAGRKPAREPGPAAVVQGQVYPWDVGPEIVRDPFSPAFLSEPQTTPPPSNPLKGEDWSQRDFPWNTPGANVRPPTNLTADDGGSTKPGPDGSRPPSQAAYRLTGVLRGPRDIAIIRTDTARYYAGVGDQLGGGYRVVSIARDRVTLSGPTGTEVLVLGRS